MPPLFSNVTKSKHLRIRIFKNKSNRQFYDQLYRTTGLKPGRIAIYREALRHSSVNEQDTGEGKLPNDNERLEFLGDAILDSAVAELLFLRYPYKKEGFLTEMRMRIVNREQMSYLANRLGLIQMMEIKPELLKNPAAVKSIAGNAMEALIGAIYLDHGYRTAKKFIIERLVGQYLDIEKLMDTTVSYKALLLKWGQQNKKKIEWENRVENQGKRDLFVVTLILDDCRKFTEKNNSRKRAEELCCEKACRLLQINS